MIHGRLGFAGPPVPLIGGLRRRLRIAVGGPARARVVLLFAAVLGLDSADKATLGAVAGELKHTFHMGNAELGMLAAATAAVSAVATVPMGVLADRTVRVRLLVASVVLWSAAMLWSGAAGSFQTLLLSRLALGVVLAAAGPVIASLVGDFFPPHERARIWGYILSGELIGAGFGFLVSGNVASVVSWRFSFWLLGCASLGLAWLLWRHLPEPKRGGQSRQSEPRAELALDEDPARMPLGRALRYVLRVRTNVVLILATTVGYFFFAGLRTFGVVFARGHFGLGQSPATSLFTLVGIGALVGVLTGGRLADALVRRGKTNARLAVPVAGFAVAAACLAPGLITTSLIIAVPLYFVGAAAFSIPNPPLEAARLDVMPSRLWGRAESIRTFVRTLAEAGAPLLFGVVADALGGSGTEHAASGLRYAFLIMLVPLALNGLILTRALRTYPQDVAAAAEADRRIAAQASSSSSASDDHAKSFAPMPPPV